MLSLVLNKNYNKAINIVAATPQACHNRHYLVKQ